MEIFQSESEKDSTLKSLIETNKQNAERLEKLTKLLKELQDENKQLKEAQEITNAKEKLTKDDIDLIERLFKYAPAKKKIFCFIVDTTNNEPKIVEKAMERLQLYLSKCVTNAAIAMGIKIPKPFFKYTNKILFLSVSKDIIIDIKLLELPERGNFPKVRIYQIPRTQIYEYLYNIDKTKIKAYLSTSNTKVNLVNFPDQITQEQMFNETEDLEKILDNENEIDEVLNKMFKNQDIQKKNIKKKNKKDEEQSENDDNSTKHCKIKIEEVKNQNLKGLSSIYSGGPIQQKITIIQDKNIDDIDNNINENNDDKNLSGKKRNRSDE